MIPTQTPTAADTLRRAKSNNPSGRFKEIRFHAVAEKEGNETTFAVLNV